jgi:hypothetical protein
VKQFFLNKKLACIACLVLVATSLPFTSASGDKIEPEEIVAKHLQSIGATETLSSIQSRIIAGQVAATMTSPKTAKFTGASIMASKGAKNTLGMGFESAGKYEERFAFDGSTVTVGYARPGYRGYLSDFVFTYDNIVKVGLVGGTLSDAWPLRNFKESKHKLEYGGVKKINNRSAHEIKFIPRGSSDLEIKLFFDTENFQHLRTEYAQLIGAGLGSGLDQSGQQRPVRYRMVEHFSDFRKEGGLMLPHGYRVELDLDGRGGRLLMEWVFQLTDFAFNQDIPASTFNVPK